MQLKDDLAYFYFFKQPVLFSHGIFSYIYIFFCVCLIKNA